MKSLEIISMQHSNAMKINLEVEPLFRTWGKIKILNQLKVEVKKKIELQKTLYKTLLNRRW